ncbi:MAG: putative Rossmann-fold nucleotide-binding protein [Pseudoalteromonas tetraodonis]|jgi:predicted Rossmann-fold nucleotide-binding protein
MNEILISEIDTLTDYAARKCDLSGCVVQGLDLRSQSSCLGKANVGGAVFLGCHFGSSAEEEDLRKRGALIFPRFNGLPYNPYRPQLYTRAELIEGYSAEEDLSADKQIYDHFVSNGKHHAGVLEAIAQRIHDHAIENALDNLLEGEAGQDAKKVVGIMGGHGTPRTADSFEKVARVARGLTQRGLFVVTGGGPGTMEAGNFGAYLGEASEDDFAWALKTLKSAPVFTDPGYLDQAAKVVERFPEGCDSLAIPTWFYGHEPSNWFSNHIAKFFSNSLREDGLLEISRYGVVFAPGSAGTTQEIFMDATQNHYKTFGHISPMVFLGTQRYVAETGLYPMLQKLAKGRDYADLLSLSDDPDEVVDFISSFQPGNLA